MTTRDRHRTRLMAAGIFVVAGLGLAGCNTEGPEEGVDVEDITEGEVAESSPAAEPEATGVPEAAPGVGYAGLYDQNFYDEADVYVGQEVTVSAEVTENISGDTFVIGGADDTAVDPLLIVEEVEVPSMVEGEVVQLTGTVQENFDVASAEELLGFELEDELYTDYIGEPYLSITSGEVLEEN